MSPGSKLGGAIRAARKENALTQGELAKKLNVTQATISNWEIGKGQPDEDGKTRLQSILGGDLFSKEGPGKTGASSVLAAWLSRSMREKDLTVAQLAEKATLSVPTIYSLQNGKAQNPRPRTIQLLEKALGKKFEEEFKQEVKRASTIEGVGEFRDFDPHNRQDWPEEPGIYVFYDISDRPIYVGMATNIASRIANHEDRFWFKRPIVEQAAYVTVNDQKLRKQFETILIKFLKSNAIINKQGVERD